MPVITTHYLDAVALARMDGDERRRLADAARLRREARAARRKPPVREPWVLQLTRLSRGVAYP